jgi:signal transduction histidine kinase
VENEHRTIQESGIVGQTVVTGKKQISDDTEKLIKTSTIPIFEHNNVKGIIEIKSSINTQFVENTLQLMELLADHISARLTTLRLESERIRVEQAEEMKRIKTRFVSTATHELRTPLTSMKGYLELALNENDLDTVRKYLEVAMRNTNRLETLTSDLLDQQKIEEGRIDISKEKINVKNLIVSILEEVSGMIKMRNQVVITNLPSSEITIIGDELRLGQVLINLLNNASKYSPDNSKIYIDVDTQEGNLVVSIRDEGLGIATSDIDKLFKPFPDIEKPVVSQRSVGLGLSICKGFIELHGGRIWAESEGYDKGSKFTFTVPLIQESFENSEG